MERREGRRPVALRRPSTPAVKRRGPERDEALFRHCSGPAATALRTAVTRHYREGCA
jgi:hypothetical protein